MKYEIRNGMTIISTGDSKGGKKNKNGYPGIHYDSKRKKHRAEMNYKRKKYHLGYSDSIPELIERRKEAELHVKHGDFIEWFNLRKGRWNDKRS